MRRTDAESDNEDGNCKEADLVAHTKLLRHARNIGRDDGTSKRYDEACDRDDHGAVPFIGMAPILRVLLIAGLKSYKFVIPAARFWWTLDLTRRHFRHILFEVRVGGKSTIWEVDIQMRVNMFLCQGSGERV